MVELFRIDSTGRLHVLERYDFADETGDLETFLMDNPRILGNLVVLGRQVQTGSKEGRIDIIALDTEGQGQVAIVELKNTHCDESVIPQILRYARWAKKNPDFILSKAKGMQEELRVKGINVDKMDTTPRVILVAPSFDAELFGMSEDLAYDVDFLSVNRYRAGNEVFVVTEVEEVEERGVGVSRSQEKWDWASYKSKRDMSDKKLEIGMAMEQAIDGMLAGKGWDLKKSFQQGQVAWKRGFFRVFWISLDYYAEKVVFAFKAKEKPTAADLGLVPDDIMKWAQDSWGVVIPSKDFDMSIFAPVLEKAYEFITGR